MHIQRLLPSALTGLLLAATLTGCGGGGGELASTPITKQKTPTTLLTQKSFKADCSDFLDYTATALTEQYLRPQIYFLGGPATGAPVPVASPSSGGDAATPDRISETTVQEAGVDEGDIVKVAADGTFYMLRGGDLLVLKGFPATGLADRPLKSLPLAAGDAGFYAQDFFLDEAGKRLVVMAQTYDGSGTRAITVVFDTTDPLNPVETTRLSLSGYSLEARRIASRVHRVLRFDMPLPGWFFDGRDTLATQRDRYNEANNRNDTQAAERIKIEMKSEIGRRVNAQGAASFLPLLGSQVGSTQTERRMACNTIQHPEVSTATGLALVDSFDSSGSNRGTVGLVNNAFLIYASAQNLYLAQTSGGWFFAPNQADETVIYRLSLSNTGAAQLQSLGKIDGYLLNRFALSENAGALRAASTENRLTGDTQQTYTHLSVLSATSTGEMTALGSVRDLAPGERVQSARFIGTRGFIVTFRQVDPLFAFDLANPAQPRLMSALKIPGFSSYIEPLGRDYLLTVGRAGDEERLNGKVAIQLFDVRDLANVRLLSTLQPAAGGDSYSYSSAEYDPHAFTYFPDSTSATVPGTLSLPLQTYGDSASQQFSGFLEVRVNPANATPLAELGRIDHDEFAESSGYCQPPPSGGAAPASCYESVWAADPRRSVFIEASGATTVYTFSTLGLKASDAANPASTLGKRKFPAEPPR